LDGIEEGTSHAWRALGVDGRCFLEIKLRTVVVQFRISKEKFCPAALLLISLLEMSVSLILVEGPQSPRDFSVSDPVKLSPFKI
jgi:hypothetical protein